MWNRKWSWLVLFLVGMAFAVPGCVNGEESPAKSENPTADTPAAAGAPSDSGEKKDTSQEALVTYKGSCGHTKTQAAGLPAPSC